MYDKCPSKSMRNLKAKIYRCRHCGAEVEMFSDELRTRCRKCRQFIFKEQMPYCIQGHVDLFTGNVKDVPGSIGQVRREYVKEVSRGIEIKQ